MPQYLSRSEAGQSGCALAFVLQPEILQLCKLESGKELYIEKLHIHTYIHTCVHMHIHTYMYVCMYVKITNTYIRTQEAINDFENSGLKHFLNQNSVHKCKA